jgi:dolichol-phosphate mannosyltransferase
VVSLVIPTYNEAGSIGGLLKEVLELPLDDIVVVDDDSPDMTATYARYFEPDVKVVVRRHVRGLAPAVRAGVQETVSRVTTT